MGLLIWTQIYLFIYYYFFSQLQLSAFSPHPSTPPQPVPPPSPTSTLPLLWPLLNSFTLTQFSTVLFRADLKFQTISIHIIFPQVSFNLSSLCGLLGYHPVYPYIVFLPSTYLFLKYIFWKKNASFLQRIIR